jgi:hypothetical protein
MTVGIRIFYAASIKPAINSAKDGEARAVIVMSGPRMEIHFWMRMIMCPEMCHGMELIILDILY